MTEQGCQGATQRLTALNAAMSELHVGPSENQISTFAQKLSAQANAEQPSPVATTLAGAAVIEGPSSDAVQVDLTSDGGASQAEVAVSVTDSADLTSDLTAAAPADSGTQNSAASANASVSSVASGESMLSAFLNPYYILYTEFVLALISNDRNLISRCPNGHGCTCYLAPSSIIRVFLLIKAEFFPELGISIH